MRKVVAADGLSGVKVGCFVSHALWRGEFSKGVMEARLEPRVVCGGQHARAKDTKDGLGITTPQQQFYPGPVYYPGFTTHLTI
jgi:hypothetical protein